MPSRQLLVCVLALVPALPAAAQFVAPGGVIPVVANLPGLNETFWRSDVSILNVGAETTSVVLQLFPEIINGVAAFEPQVSASLPVAEGEQLSLANVVQSQFGMVNVKGSLWVASTDGTPLVISSRTYTNGEAGGTFGQDVTSVQVTAQAWVAGLQHDGFYRSNLGIFWPWDLDGEGSVQFDVRVVTGDGDEIGSGTLGFTEPGLQQVSLDAFDLSGLLLDGYVVINCSDTSSPWYGYASRVDQITGDAVFRVARGYLIQ